MKRLIAVVAMTAMVLLGSGGLANAQPPKPDLSQQEVAAVAGSGIVYLEMFWTGYVRYPSQAETWEWSKKAFTAGFRCTGFVLTPNGYIGTAGHCVDPNEDGTKDQLIHEFLVDQVQQGYLTQAEAAAIDADKTYTANWEIDGGPANGGGFKQVQLAIVAYTPGAASGINAEDKMTASVVEFLPWEQGDVGLLKVEPSIPLATLQLAATNLQVGDEIASVGYPGDVSKTVDPSTSPSFKTGRVSALQTQHGLPFTQFDAAILPGMSGGPLVNSRGEVVGINSQFLTAASGFSFATGLTTLTRVLDSNSVKHDALSPADTAYRAGLDAFYAGRYHEAADQFDTTLAAIPNHALAQKFKRDATAKFGEESWISQVPLWSIGVVGLAVLAVLALGTVLVVRKRRKVDPAPTAELDPRWGQRGEEAPTVVNGTRFCHNCGLPIKMGARYCDHCGSSHEPVPATVA